MDRGAAHGDAAVAELDVTGGQGVHLPAKPAEAPAAVRFHAGPAKELRGAVPNRHFRRAVLNRKGRHVRQRQARWPTTTRRDGQAGGVEV